MPKLKTALMFMAGNFVGREYFAQLSRAGRTPDLVLTVGTIKPDSVAWEERRTGGLWNPPDVPQRAVRRHFERMADPDLWQYLRDEKIDVAIQGGIGILKSDMIAAPRLAFVNVHPGDLPAYRGNACPEWQLYNRHPLVATAHVIDEGIDTGPVITKKAMPIPSDWSYERIRANVYAHCAEVLIEALDILDRLDGRPLSDVAHAQDETGAKYWPQIPPEHIDVLRQRLGSEVGRAS